MVELVIRVVFSLAVVLGLLWFIARTSSRRFGGAARSMVRIVARQPLARSASLAVVEVGDRVLVVGVSENGVSLLTELDPSELPASAESTVEDLPVGRHLAELGRVPAPATTPARTPATTTVPGLSGSVLSAQTWRQAWAAATGRNGTTGD